MPLDDLVLGLQGAFDRLIRRLRLGAPPVPGQRRLLIVQIDGLSRAVLEDAITRGRVPFLARLLHRGGYQMVPMCAGLPTSTPAFQLAAMYGVRPDIPGFHYHDKRRRTDVYFPRGGDAAHVEATQAAGRRGIVEGGSTYGCVFTGGAANNVFNFAMLKRPSGGGLLRLVSAFVVLAWVLVKGTARSSVEITRAVLRLIADPVAESRRGWKWLLLKVGVSIWARQFFTLAVSRDLYAGVPAIYVNYLDYDVFAHTYGPRHRRALRSLRRVDRSIQQLWRAMRRVPEHRYDLYVLSDHGQLHCIPYVQLLGRGLERVLIEEFFEPVGAHVVSPEASHGRRLARGIKATRSRRAPGMWQRFVNYLEQDFPSLLGELPEAHEHGGVRVIGAGPNAFVYFLETADALGLEWIDQRWPGLADDISRSRGVGFVLVRSASGPVCITQGKRHRLDRNDAGPFGARPDRSAVLTYVRDLMAMPSAGDLVIYGHDSPDGNVSYVAEIGAHAGPSTDELYTFVVCRRDIELPRPITHPVELYPHFLGYRAA